MKKMTMFILSLSAVLMPLSFPSAAAVALPLSTSSRWIVDGDGHRVKLACVNWVSHLEPVVAEGLSKRSMDDISHTILSMGFNCVRLTWPLFLATNDSLASLTVRQSFLRLGLEGSVAGIQANNPDIVDLPLIDAFRAVVSNLGDNNVMVILDNHISKPGWCCSSNDGNGFYGDTYFDPDSWLTGLNRMANLFNGVPNVVGMSLRNELRGSRQNTGDWYKYMQKGAEAVHSANPDVLVIVSGLNYDKDLSFLKSKPLSLSFSGKVVYEVHWYGFSDGSAWQNGNPNEVCGNVVNNMLRLSGYLLQQSPLFLSEYGLDQRGTNVNDNRYISCFMGTAAEFDLDWAYWTLVGSYYLREGVAGSDETYGILNKDWSGARNPSILQKISSLQLPFKGPGLSDKRPHLVIFHPLTGLCVLRTSWVGELKLGSCTESDGWKYTPPKTLTVLGTYFCLQVDDLGKPAKLGIICTDSNSKWDVVSDSKMHLSSKSSSGKTVCLDVDSSNTVVTNTCKCLNSDSNCDPASQWFKLVETTTTPRPAKLVNRLQLPGHGKAHSLSW
ncbi:hypothetical protein MLD38_017023 [Melastoma candidum]|uniref:Uncharacterized protein n=1 Tax=Melastoma candidum TaxID=119954 RepID=A0ACB9QXI9_9MYRT|nr:hypothetical protein MLD38_017023 [Melastoma candidum]